MRLDYAFICDYAEVTDKVSAMGIGFEVICSSPAAVSGVGFTS